MQRAKQLLIVLAVLIAVVVLGLTAFVYLLPEKAARAAIAAGRKQAGLVRKEIFLPSALRFSYLEGGQGPPLMLLHGFGANKDCFLAVAPFLTKRFRVIIPDLIGFGDSAHLPDVDYGPPAQAERLRELAQALEMGKLHLGGSSMGGQVALTYAAMHPQEVASLWLINPAGIWSAPKSELLERIAFNGRNPLLARNEEEFIELLAFVMSNPPFIPKPVLKVLAQERIRNFELEERIFPQLLAYSVEPHLKGVTIPTLILWGEQDRTLHNDTVKILQECLPQAKVCRMPGIGHLPMIETPRKSAEEYLKFRAALAGP